MQHLLFSLLWLLLRVPWIYAAWRWGDWRNWKLYLPTIQFMILANLTYQYFTFNFPLWRYDLSPLGSFVLADMLMMLVVFPCFVVLYLTHFPKNLKKRCSYIGIWFIAVALMEWGFSFLGIIHYYNGWNLYMSFAFDMAIFIMIPLHFRKPLLTYVLSIVFTVLLLYIFHVPVGKVCPSVD